MRSPVLIHQNAHVLGISGTDEGLFLTGGGGKNGFWFLALSLNMTALSSQVSSLKSKLRSPSSFPRPSLQMDHGGHRILVAPDQL